MKNTIDKEYYGFTLSKAKIEEFINEKPQLRVDELDHEKKDELLVFNELANNLTKNNIEYVIAENNYDTSVKEGKDVRIQVLLLSVAMKLYKVNTEYIEVLKDLSNISGFDYTNRIDILTTELKEYQGKNLTTSLI